jgi:hypothetical protein
MCFRVLLKAHSRSSLHPGASICMPANARAWRAYPLSVDRKERAFRTVVPKSGNLRLLSTYRMDAKRSRHRLVCSTMNLRSGKQMPMLGLLSAKKTNLLRAVWSTEPTSHCSVSGALCCWRLRPAPAERKNPTNTRPSLVRTPMSRRFQRGRACHRLEDACSEGATRSS